MEVHRKLDSTLMSVSVSDEIAEMKRGEQWSSTHRGAKTLVRNDELRIVLAGLSAGMMVHEHRAEGAISLAVAQGAICFKTEGEDRAAQRRPAHTRRWPASSD